MALMLSLSTSPLGVGFPAAYARVARVHGDKDGIRALVEIHANAGARVAGAQPVETRVHDLPLQDDAPLYPAVYDALKALPDYAGAVDC